MLQYFKSWVTIYSTSRQVQIKSTLLAVCQLLIVITVWVAYLGSLNLNLKNVYQKSCPVQGAIVSKVKGHLSTEDIPDSAFKISNPELYRRIWDTSDLVFPPYGGDGQDGSFIAVTNLLITPNQTRGVCAESSKSNIAFCSKDKDCVRGKSVPTSSGVMTGKCMNDTGTCEISAWCPVEQNILPLKEKNRALLEGVKDFTIMLKNSVEFPECGKGQDYHRRNILDNATKQYLSSCSYHTHNDTMCPIFRLGDIIEWSGSNFSHVALTGGVFRIEANWDCDFDWGAKNSWCFPKYRFERIDEPNATISPGWNFRTSFYHEENRRTLIKMYGLKILVVVSGSGKQFDFLQLILALGATIGLFSVAPLFCDTLFEFLCYLKRFKPCQKMFGDFSVKSRYQGSEVYSPKSSPNKFELAASNNTIEESIGSYKPS
ncbi:P2X purinoceptor 4 [Folsomia candida]|uniref:P2X purinoceptor 4 n=1 Tax=Folsomia candida TaxID=158441 RepID=UPI000B8FFD0A|nr:P2X purinoceptor 4 [Folsomia candida]XP_035705495.1 P2X purinoceptor 4 [Folsomia candida]XP_035705496.1 P2X purinoceptor 4 [Folsomia candida]